MKNKYGISNPIDMHGFIENTFYTVKQVSSLQASSQSQTREDVENDYFYKHKKNFKGNTKDTVKKNTPKIVAPKNDKVLLCAIGKMENLYIREWVEHYKNLGFDNIVLFDNNDVEGEHFETVIGDYIKNGFVILKNARGFFQYQIESYNVCYKEYRKKYEWIAYFDIDEFLELDKKYKNVKEFLSDPIFNNYNSIRVCWENYDDNGLIKVTNNNYSIKRFTHPIQGDNQTKAFVRTTIPHINTISPHIMSKKTFFKCCNSVGERCPMMISIGVKASLQNAKLKHYRFKTIEEYIKGKMVRLWPTHYKNGGKDALNLDFFFKYNKKTAEKENFGNNLINASKKTQTKKQETYWLNSWIHKDGGTISHFNWGDELNYFFLQEIMGVKFKVFQKTNTKDINYQFIGSILANGFTNKNTIVWGTGIASENSLINIKPKQICAVRGPLTRKVLLKNKIDCPEVYGDPALLLPYYYKPTIKKKYKYGFIPHHTNVNLPWIKQLEKDKDILVIKLKNYKNWTDIIDEMLSCENIISESLHGLIVAEAYEIPNVWMKINFSKQPMKYHDFFLSLGKDREKPYIVSNKTTKKEFEKWCSQYKHYNTLDLQKLIDACPFKLNLKTKPMVKVQPKTNEIVEEKKQQQSNDVKLYGVTITYNEERMIPYVMPYYENLGMDKLIVYDNESTDNTVELLKQYPFVEVRTFKTDHTLNDKINSELKDKAYLEFKKEDGIKWMTVGDFDEVLYYNGDKTFKEYLAEKTEEGYNYFNKEMLEPLCENFPSTSALTHEQTELMHHWGTSGCKMTLFNIDDIYKLHYSPGAHKTDFSTKSGIKKSLNDEECLQGYHLKYIDYEYNRQKYKHYANRRSQLNKQMGWGAEYTNFQNDDTWNKHWKNLIGQAQQPQKQSIFFKNQRYKTQHQFYEY